MREDDHDGSDEERMDMDVNPVLRDQERRREQFLAAQDSDHDLDDDWEDQQIRKGVTSKLPLLIDLNFICIYHHYRCHSCSNGARIHAIQ